MKYKDLYIHTFYMGMKSIGCLHKLFIFLQESCMLCIFLTYHWY